MNYEMNIQNFLLEEVCFFFLCLHKWLMNSTFHDPMVNMNVYLKLMGIKILYWAIISKRMVYTLETSEDSICFQP